MGLFSKIKDGLKKTKDAMVKQVETIIHSFTKIDDEFFEELQETLIISDVGYDTSEYICQILKTKVKQKGITDPSEIKELLKEIIAEILTEPQNNFEIDDEFETAEEIEESEIDNIDNNIESIDEKKIILVIGVNGVGKTTTIGKLAYNYTSAGKKVILAAADTFRAAAVEQLGIWADRSDSILIKNSNGADPASVVYDAVLSGRSKNADFVICDTAGRLHNKKNLMNELSKISRVIHREAGDFKVEVYLVLDASTGQNALVQAREFQNDCEITGIVLTKLDGTAKGGIVIAISHELKIPVKYVGVGEKIDDLQEFSAIEFADALFDD